MYREWEDQVGVSKIAPHSKLRSEIKNHFTSKGEWQKLVPLLDLTNIDIGIPIINNILFINLNLVEEPMTSGE